MSNEAPMEGWYPDPEGGPRLRWWDGGAWTDQFRSRPLDRSKLVDAEDWASTQSGLQAETSALEEQADTLAGWSSDNGVGGTGTGDLDAGYALGDEAMMSAAGPTSGAFVPTEAPAGPEPWQSDELAGADDERWNRSAPTFSQPTGGNTTPYVVPPVGQPNQPPPTAPSAYVQSNAPTSQGNQDLPATYSWGSTPNYDPRRDRMQQTSFLAKRYVWISVVVIGYVVLRLLVR